MEFFGVRVMNDRFFGFRSTASRLAAAGLIAATPFAPSSAQSLGGTVVDRASVSVEAPAAIARGPVEAALQTALTLRGDDDLSVFYAARGHRPLWVGDAARIEGLTAALGEAGDHGLPHRRYLIGDDIADLAAGAPADAARAELALTDAYLALAGDLAAGVVAPRALDKDLHLFPERPAPGHLLQMAALPGDPAKAALRTAPIDPQYARVREMVKRLDQIAAAGGWGPEVAAGPTLRPGEVGRRVEALRIRLIAMGDHPPVETVSPRYDPELQAAVEAFQARHGLNRDGVAGAATLAAVNASPEDRRDQALATLERMRWTPRELGERHIWVNLADFRVTVRDGDDVLFTERVVIGKNRHRTPEFSDRMTHLVFNPSWHVPYSIATKEILPKLKADPGYLAAENMELSGPETNAWAVDWSQYSRGAFPFRIRQRPGPGNALGQVKFMFPNDFSIYLHDTPSKRLFAKDRRAFSHGCVRVQDPLSLARALLAAKWADAPARIDHILASGKERTVFLEEPMPVHLSYRTAWVDENGVMQFREDVYGRDAQIREALRALGVGDRGGV